MTGVTPAERSRRLAGRIGVRADGGFDPTVVAGDAGVGDSAPEAEPLSAAAGRSRSPGRLRVLLVSSRTDSDALQHAWTGQAADVRPCTDLAAALVLVGRLTPDVIVIGDSGGSGGSIDPVLFLRAVRQVDTSVPVIVGVRESRPLLGPDVLSAGATAVVRCPFSPGDLLRLLYSTSDGAHLIKPLPIDLGRLRVDGAAPRMWLDGVETVLPPMEFLLLRYLAERHGEILPRRELLTAAWGDRPSASSNSLAVHLARLRNRLEGDSDEDWIRPIRGIGYQFLVPARLPTPPGQARPAS